MLLSEIIPRLEIRARSGPEDCEVSAVRHDSREVGPADLFVALQGGRVDARRFVPALRCAAVIAEGPVRTQEGVALLQVPDARRALALAASALAGDPSRRLPVIGVTGTNGKTTTTFMLEAIAAAAGQAAGVIGTTGHRIAGQLQPASHTTPEAPVVQELLGRALQAGCRLVAMEVSSIGLDLKRVDGVEFAAAVYTNLSRDHLDFHGDMAAYARAKSRLFSELLAPGGTAVLNGMDPAAAAIAAPGRQRWTFGLGDGYDICAMEPSFDLQGCRAELRSPRGRARLELQLLGRHNLENALGALGAALAVGLPLDQAVGGLSSLRAVPGRLESVPGPAGLTVLVDYAHSPDALERVLATLRPLCQGRVLTVFGCGGDRDAGKRPLMGAAASAGSDIVFLTSDNPRSEDPEAIIRDILPGLRGEHRVEPLRERAIGAAIAEARRGDVVLIAGKGHESTQTIGDRVFPFDDRLVAAAALAGWKEQ